jgi:hypothetical protein
MATSLDHQKSFLASPVYTSHHTQNALFKKSNYNITLQLKDFSPILLYPKRENPKSINNLEIPK